jgi:uncharacterized protein YjbJ (UPF0337 family)
MVTRQELEGQWTEVKGRLQEKWGSLTDNELYQARGNVNQLVGVIEQKTGEKRKDIEDFLEEVVSGDASQVERATAAVKGYAEHASEAVRQNYDKAAAAMRDQYGRTSETVMEQYGQAQECVRRNPMESMLVSFGAGILTGVVLGLSMRRR